MTPLTDTALDQLFRTARTHNALGGRVTATDLRTPSTLGAAAAPTPSKTAL